MREYLTAASNDVSLALFVRRSRIVWLKIILSFSGAGLYGLPLFVVCIGYGDKMLCVRIIKKRVCQNTLFITKDRYIAELSYEVAI